MATYQGSVTDYNFSIYTPNVFTNYKGVIALRGAFGMALLYFVPDGDILGTNQKRPGEDVIDLYYWASSWMPFIDMLRNEKEVSFFYDDTGSYAEIRSGIDSVG